MSLRMKASQRLQMGRCECELPCSCIDLDGVRYYDWKALVDELEARTLLLDRVRHKLVWKRAWLDRNGGRMGVDVEGTWIVAEEVMEPVPWKHSDEQFRLARRETGKMLDRLVAEGLLVSAKIYGPEGKTGYQLTTVEKSV